MASWEVSDRRECAGGGDGVVVVVVRLREQWIVAVATKFKRRLAPQKA